MVANSPPYFQKDALGGTWKGAAIEMAKSIAAVWGAELVYVETTFGNSVLDVQSNKVDIAFALNPTPQRALAIGFTRPYIVAPYGCIAKAGLSPKTWSDLNKPDIRVAFDLGSLHETCARRFAPKAQLTGFKTTDDCILALQGGRVDVQVLATTVGLGLSARTRAWVLITCWPRRRYRCQAATVCSANPTPASWRSSTPGSTSIAVSARSATR